jgi:hypothetical protein
MLSDEIGKFAARDLGPALVESDGERFGGQQAQQSGALFCPPFVGGGSPRLRHFMKGDRR